jgi:hypothetical protein
MMMRVFMRVAARISVHTFFAFAGYAVAQPVEALRAIEGCYIGTTGLVDAMGVIPARSDAQRKQLNDCLEKTPIADPRRAYLLGHESRTGVVCDAKKVHYLPAIEACGLELADSKKYQQAHVAFRKAVEEGSALALGILLEESMDEDGFGAVIPLADKAFYKYLSCRASEGLIRTQFMPEHLYIPAIREAAAKLSNISQPLALKPEVCVSSVDQEFGSKLTKRAIEEIQKKAAVTAASLPAKVSSFLTQYPEYRVFNALTR